MTGMFGDERVLAIIDQDTIAQANLCKKTEKNVHTIKGNAEKVLQGEWEGDIDGSYGKEVIGLISDEGAEDYDLGGEIGDGDHE